MKVFDVELLAYDEQRDCHIVRYSVDKGTGVIRRSVATYSGGHLSRDEDKPELIEKVEKLVRFSTIST